MTENEMKHVFDAFGSLSNEKSQSLNRNGNGVGLSICKQICQSLGGDIIVESQNGFGSNFQFTMKVLNDQSSSDQVLLALEESAIDLRLPPQNCQTSTSLQAVINMIEPEQHRPSEQDEEETLVQQPQSQPQATVVHFNGYIFDLYGDRSQPRCASAQKSRSNPQCKESNSKLISFLSMLNSHDLLKNVVNEGKIIYADDQVINQKLLQLSMKEAGVADRLSMFGDGKETIDYFKELLDNILHDPDQVPDIIQPVSLLLLDINMPGISGIEATKQVKRLFNDANERLSNIRR